MLAAVKRPSSRRTSVFADPVVCTVVSLSRARVAAASLCGMVTLYPWTGICSYASTACGSCPRGTRNGRYSASTPSFLYMWLCSSGLRLCPTGSPTTPNTFVSAVIAFTG